MQRLIDAAKELTRYLWKVQDWGGTYIETCIDDVDVAIADAERQAADDAELITSAWMQSEFSDMASWSEKRGYFLTLPCCSIKWNTQRDVLVINDVDVPHIKNRGQLRKLIAALKGGE